MAQTKQQTAPAARTEDLHAAARALFGAAHAAGRLPHSAWPLLVTAMAFLEAARQIDAAHASRIARDMVLAAPFHDLSGDEQCIVASVLAFQRKKLRRQRETAFLRLKRRDRALTLRLAAVLRLADALSAHASLPIAAQHEGGRTVLLIGGSRAVKRLAAVEQRAKHWRQSIGDIELRPVAARELAALVTHTDGADVVVEVDMAGRDVARLRGDMLMHSAARRELRRLFEKMLKHARKVPRSTDPEDVHKMRVATRQLRASLQIVEAAFVPAVIEDFHTGLKRVAKALGAVRDQDVFLAHVRAYRATLAPDEQAALDPLEHAVEQQRAAARERLFAELRSRRYKTFVRRFATFLTSPEAALAPPPLTGVPPRVRDGAGSLLWRRYEELRAFEAVMAHADDVTLHHARIAGKRLRYALEFFEEALGPQAAKQIALLTQLQNVLGALHDGVVAQELIASLGLAGDPGAQQYCAARAVESEKLRGELPNTWDTCVSMGTRRQLADILVAI
jgi:CHAD domain-containing protein